MTGSLRELVADPAAARRRAEAGRKLVEGELSLADNERLVCPACAGAMLSRRMRLDRATLGICERCGHGVTLIAPRHLGASDYASTPGERERFETLYLPARRRGYRRGLDALRDTRGRKLLDFGCNYGHFLAMARDADWSVRGYEPGEGLRRLTLESVAGLVHATLEEAAEHGPFDVITLWDVLEHVQAPEVELGRLRLLLAAGGQILVRVPDARVLTALSRRPDLRAIAPIYLKMVHPTNPEEHFHHFTPASLGLVASRAGLREVARLEAEPDERIAAGKTRIDAFVRRVLHRSLRDLPYEFIMVLEAGEDSKTAEESSAAG